MIDFSDPFWAKVDKSGGLTECWMWKGIIQKRWRSKKKHQKANGGYGHCTRPGKSGPFLAHRVAYELANGPIPTGLNVNHTCDVKACVNPAHLYAGTQEDNMRDAIRRGQIKVGMTQEQVLAARVLRIGGWGFDRISNALGVPYGSVRKAFWGSLAYGTTGPDDPLRARNPARHYQGGLRKLNRTPGTGSTPVACAAGDA